MTTWFFKLVGSKTLQIRTDFYCTSCDKDFYSTANKLCFSIRRHVHAYTRTHTQGDVNFRASLFFPYRTFSHAFSLCVSSMIIHFVIPASRLEAQQQEIAIVFRSGRERMAQREKDREWEEERGGLEPWWMWLFSCRDFLRLVFLSHWLLLFSRISSLRNE